LLIGLGVGTINLFAKRKIGWGLANRVEDGLSGINLLSYGIGDYNRYNMFGMPIHPHGKARIHPEQHSLLGIIGHPRYHHPAGRPAHRHPPPFLTFGQELKGGGHLVYRAGSHRHYHLRPHRR
jgi:hypothetical protein